MRERLGPDYIIGVSPKGSEPWAFGQVVTALHGTTLVVPDDVARKMAAMRIKGCACRGERTESLYPENIVADAWVLIGLATVDRVPADAVSHLLAIQQPRGWWSIFPQPGSDAAASTYATALVTMALAGTLDKKGLDKATRRCRPYEDSIPFVSTHLSG